MPQCGGYTWLTFLAACSHGSADAATLWPRTDPKRHVIDDADAAGSGHMRLHTYDLLQTLLVLMWLVVFLPNIY